MLHALNCTNIDDAYFHIRVVSAWSAVAPKKDGDDDDDDSLVLHRPRHGNSDACQASQTAHFVDNGRTTSH